MLGKFANFTLFLLVSVNSSSSQGTVAGDRINASEPEQVRLSEILIPCPKPNDRACSAEKQKALEVRQAIRLGGAFADLARVNSQAPTAAQGGDLGYFKRGVLLKSIEKRLFQMQVGEVSDVIRTKQGYVILQVTARGPEERSDRGSSVVDYRRRGLTGRVIDSFNHEPISNAYVLVHQDGAIDAHVRTDENGRYSVDLEPGIYDVLISAEGYSPASRKVQIDSEGKMIFDAGLDFNCLGMEQMVSISGEM